MKRRKSLIGIVVHNILEVRQFDHGGEGVVIVVLADLVQECPIVTVANFSQVRLGIHSGNLRDHKLVVLFGVGREHFVSATTHRLELLAEIAKHARHLVHCK